MTRGFAAWSLAGLLMLITGSPAQAQGNRHGASELLTEFSDRSQDSLSHRAGLVIGDILLRNAENPRARVDSLLVGLARIAAEGERPAAIEAVTMLGAPGFRTVPHPLPGTVLRLRRIYSRSSDPMVRRVIVGSMGWQAERVAAIAFVRKIAMAEPGHEDFPDAVHEAIRVLLAMGTEGRAVVSDLHRRRLVRIPEERHNLELLDRAGELDAARESP